MSCPIAPPAQGDWYVLDTVVADVLARLRLQSTDPDKPRIEALVPVAATHINAELDRLNEMTPTSATGGEPPAPLETNVTPDILESLSRLTIELFRRGRSDTAGNITANNITFDMGGVMDVVREDLSSHKSRWGLA